MKKTLLIFLLSYASLFAQVGYVEYSNPIYGFLKRMDSFGLLTDYDEFEIPKTRKEIAGYLKEIIAAKEKLSPLDRKILDDFITEFEFDLYGTTKYAGGIFNDGLSTIFSQRENYLFYFTEKKSFSVFANFLGDAKYFGRNYLGDSLQSTSIFDFGGIARVSFYDKIGFSIKATNGTFLGNRNLAASTENRKYNYKIHTTTSSNLGNDFFDETEGYLLGEFDYLKFKIGRDRKIVGYLNFHPLVSTFSPPMDYIQLNLNYKNFGFSFFHGKLLGTSVVVFDTSQNNNPIFEKFISYHRFYYNFSNHLKIGAGEIIIYANRGVDFSYLNPFNFYKSTEHANQDRDNSMLFFDLTNNSVNGLKFYATLLIDDIDFGKLGSGWYGNQTLLHIGAYSSQLFNILPIEIETEYLRIDPYVFTHRLNYNNFTSLGYSIGTPIQPNSSTFGLRLNYLPHYRIRASLKFSYTVHGANVTGDNSNTVKNYGGDILVGHRVNDSEQVYFLQGIKEYIRNFYFDISYEPYNNFFAFLSLNFANESRKGNISRKIFDSQFGLKIKL